MSEPITDQTVETLVETLIAQKDVKARRLILNDATIPTGETVGQVIANHITVTGDVNAGTEGTVNGKFINAGHEVYAEQNVLAKRLLLTDKEGKVRKVPP